MQKPWEIDTSLCQDETELLAALRRRDRGACTCLLKRFAPRLYHLAVQLMGEVDEAEDVLQESFIQACTHVVDFEGRSSLGTWLHRIVLNTALMRLRRRQPGTVRFQSDDEISSEAEAWLDQSGEPCREVLALELRDMVDQAVVALPDTLRAAFVLRDIEGLSTKQAADALGISETALKVRLHRARQELRSSLASYVEQTADPGDDLQRT